MIHKIPDKPVFQTTLSAFPSLDILVFGLQLQKGKFWDQSTINIQSWGGEERENDCCCLFLDKKGLEAVFPAVEIFGNLRVQSYLRSRQAHVCTISEDPEAGTSNVCWPPRTRTQPALTR